jgi:hypothetical protein
MPDMTAGSPNSVRPFGVSARPAHYHANRIPNRTCRSLPSFVAVMTAKPFRSRMDPSGLRRRLETFVLPLPGFWNRGRFVTLNISIRTCRFISRCNWNCRNTPRSHDATPGPRKRLNGAVPKRASVTGRNASGSK